MKLDVLSGCDICKHREVCEYREQREKLLMALAELEMPTPFTLNVDCAYFDNSMTITGTSPLWGVKPMCTSITGTTNTSTNG